MSMETHVNLVGWLHIGNAALVVLIAAIKLGFESKEG